MKGHLILLLTVTLSPVVSAQVQQDSTRPLTKLEAFQTKTGIVMIRGFSRVGTINGTGTIEVTAREFRDASNPAASKVSGIGIRVKEAGRLERESISFVDFDEIESLIAGIEYISKVTKDVTQLQSFEIEYRTKGDFSVIVFNTGTGALNVAVSSGRIGKTTAFFDFEELARLSTLISTAKSRL